MADSALETVKAFEEAALYERDFEGAMKYAHPNLTVREPPGLPYRDVYVGLQGQRDLLADVDRLWSFEGGAPKVDFREVGPDLVIGRVTGRATLQATKKIVDFLVVEFFTLENGRISDIEVFYWDQADLIDAGSALRSATGPLGP